MPKFEYMYDYHEGQRSSYKELNPHRIGGPLCIKASDPKKGNCYLEIDFDGDGPRVKVWGDLPGIPANHLLSLDIKEEMLMRKLGGSDGR